MSGSFTTGAGAPALGSVFPTDGDESVPTNATVTFRFTQPMKKIALPGGVTPAVRWSGTGLDPVKFQYTWSADARSSRWFIPAVSPKTLVGWELNPAGATTVLESQSGQTAALGKRTPVRFGPRHRVRVRRAIHLPDGVTTESTSGQTSSRLPMRTLWNRARTVLSCFRWWSPVLRWGPQ